MTTFATATRAHDDALTSTPAPRRPTREDYRIDAREVVEYVQIWCARTGWSLRRLDREYVSVWQGTDGSLRPGTAARLLRAMRAQEKVHIDFAERLFVVMGEDVEGLASYRETSARLAEIERAYYGDLAWEVELSP